MTERGLREAVKHAAEALGGADEAAVTEAVRILQSPDVLNVLEDPSKGPTAKMAKLAANLTAAAQANENSRSQDTRSSARNTTSPERLALIEADVREVRNRIFGSFDPPFETYDPDSLDWLHSHSSPYLFPPIKALQDPRAGISVEDWLDQQIPRSLKKWFEFSFEPRVLLYYDPASGTISKLEVGLNTALDFLRWFLREAWEVTQLPQPSLLIYVLTGARPIVPRWLITDRRQPGSVTFSQSSMREEEVEAGEGATHETLSTRKSPWSDDPHPYAIREGWEIRINATDYTWEEHKEVYEVIQEMRGPRSEILDYKDRTLIEILREEGGLPPKGARGNGEFWERVQRRCMQRGIESFKTPDAPRKRASRLIERGHNLSPREMPLPSSSVSFRRWRDRRRFGKESPPLEGAWRKD